MTGPIIITELRKNSRERVRVALDEYQGHHLLDIRVLAQLTESSDVWTGTKKGVAVNVALIPILREALEAAEAQARQMGWIVG